MSIVIEKKKFKNDNFPVILPAKFSNYYCFKINFVLLHNKCKISFFYKIMENTEKENYGHMG